MNGWFAMSTTAAVKHKWPHIKGMVLPRSVVASLSDKLLRRENLAKLRGDITARVTDKRRGSDGITRNGEDGR